MTITTLTRFDWCIHGLHTVCHAEGTTPNGRLVCNCDCHKEERHAA